MAESSNSEKVIPVTVSRPMGHAINENQRSWKQIAEMYIREDKSFADVADDDEQNQRFLSLLQYTSNAMGREPFHILKMHFHFQTLFEQSIIGRKMKKEIDRLLSENFTISEARIRGLLHSVSILEDYIDIPPLDENVFRAFLDLSFRDRY